MSLFVFNEIQGVESVCEQIFFNQYVSSLVRKKTQTFVFSQKKVHEKQTINNFMVCFISEFFQYIFSKFSKTLIQNSKKLF